MSSALFTPKLKSCSAKNDLKSVSLERLLKLMFAYFKFSQLKIQVSDNFNPMENSIIQFSVIDC